MLYIDDLDRCSTKQVVEVLQAVHLLLAFELFVVVVGVDPRWLLRSLRLHHAALAEAEASAENIAVEELAQLAATPQAYLEKIFQIPFRLRPMRPGGYSRLMRSVLNVRPEATPEQPSPQADTRAPDAAATVPYMPSPTAEPAAPTEPEDLVPRRLVIERHENEFIDRLVPLVPTPRAAKRLANLYRLVRAQITPSGAAGFVGTGGIDAD